MVNKNEKTEGAKKVAATTAPKGRVTSKPKAATRAKGDAPATKAVKTVTAIKAAKPTKKTAAKPAAIRQEDIAFRAYLIGEKRQQQGISGDSLSDWVEAEQQLLGEWATRGVN